MIDKAQLEQLSENIRRGMDEAQANVYRSQGALELLAHLIKMLDEAEQPAPAQEA